LKGLDILTVARNWLLAAKTTVARWLRRPRATVSLFADLEVVREDILPL
jgi:hypothetical protein